MAADKYLAELEALQRWVKATANVDSIRHKGGQQISLPRPVILWEAPHRGKDRDLQRYKYTNKVTQYGKLFVASIEELAAIQEALLGDLEEKVGVLPIVQVVTNPDTGQRTESVVGKLLKAEITFNNSENLDVPFNIVYEVTYKRVRPLDPPPPAHVGNRITSKTYDGQVFNVRGYN